MKGRALPPEESRTDALFMQGFSLHQQGDVDQASALYARVLEKEPRHFDALHLLGVIASERGDPSRAVDWIGKAIQVNPGVAEAQMNMGKALTDLSRLDEALASHDQAIQLKPDLAEAHCGRGIVLQRLRRLDDALGSYAQAIRLRSDYAEAYFNMGEAFKDQRRFSEALAAYEASISIQPEIAVSWCGRGIALSSMRRHEEAVASYARAIAIMPSYANAYLNLGSALKDLGRIDEALAMYDQAIAVKPDFAEAFTLRASALHGISRFDDALASYRRALELRPSYDYLPGLVMHLRHRLCEWGSFDVEHQRFAGALATGSKVSPPFIVSTMLDAPAIQKIAAEEWVRSMCPSQAALGPLSERPRQGRIRLGYYSADFHDHATCCLMAELFELHDKDQFELFAFSFGPNSQDAVRRRVVDAFDRFIDVSCMSDIDVARLSRELGIDIAVDLKGHTQNARPRIFSYRCAPVQVNYLGYPGTMGADYIDYLIADRVLIPEGSEMHYSEKIAFLPYSYQVNDTRRKLSDSVMTRESMGLPPDGFVFCCFNNSFKITPHTFEGWMRILKAVEGSVLWLLDDNPTATRNLKQTAQARGIDPGRLIFGPRLPQAEHLARHRCADLFLDTLPCNAHTTASDALWVGLPVLTLMGHSFAGRVAASLLNAMELPELITRGQEEYEKLAVQLATHSSLLKVIREKVAANRRTAPLYNTALFTRHLERAYTQMHQHHRNARTSNHIFIQP